ncbi:hypothetical protein SUSAZ_06460 [Sulfolobus acidocaldarius SUSAZ]|nr:hypothetical protein SUSAZ_06460 [Sulfolobus acidocaldarius SUSAZ]
MKIDDLIKVASDFPFPVIGEIELADEILDLEQSPQLISYLSPSNIRWKYNAEIIGKDGSIIKTNGNELADKKFLIRTPIQKRQLGWDFILDTKSIQKLLLDLIPCEEGEGYLNPSPWIRKDWIESKKIIMAPGEVTITPQFRDHELIKEESGTIKLDSNFYNPKYYYLNPFIISSSSSVEGKSNFFSLELDNCISFVSGSNLSISNNMGSITVNADSQVIITRSRTWNESKPYEIVWNLRTPIIKLNCKPKYRVSLYSIYPSGIIPFWINYDKGELKLGLVNLNKEPILSDFSLAGRITKALILDSHGKITDELEPEFDRVKIPIRSLGITFVKLEVKKLLDPLLRRKIITI